VVGAVLLVGFYIYRIETGRIESAKFEDVQKTWNQKSGEKLRSHEWRLSRVERRLGVKRHIRQAVQIEDEEEPESWFWRN